jgi:hypothetical protein
MGHVHTTESTRPPWLLKQPAGPVLPGGARDVLPDDAAQPTQTRPDDPTVYRCRGCGAFLARPRDLLPVHGQTLHDRVNPAGFPCRFITVGRCQNTREVSTPQADFTWFDGHAWVVMACAPCQAHLGWRWQGPTTFWGLLVNQIVQSAGTAGDAS